MSFACLVLVCEKAEGRPKFLWVNGLYRFLEKVLFYCFSPERGAGITLCFECLVICVCSIAREFFPQFMAMPDRLPPLFRHIRHLVATYHFLLHRCVLIENT